MAASGTAPPQGLGRPGPLLLRDVRARFPGAVGDLLLDCGDVPGVGCRKTLRSEVCLLGGIDHLLKQEEVTPHTASAPRTAPCPSVAGGARRGKPGRRDG